MSATPFVPPFYLRNAMLQTFWGSKRPGFFRSRSMLTAAQPITLTTPEGVRLGGLLSCHDRANRRGMVILLHGWEGSVDSAYVRSTGEYLFGLGFDVFRLNLRDHGNTHHLNEGLFYATLLDEVCSAVVQAARLAAGAPVYVCGFSLGGNFALRIAAKLSREARGTLPIEKVLAVSPVLDPSRATDVIDGNPLIRRYFLKKWQRSLKTKQRLFPRVYAFDDVLELGNLRQMTDRLIARYSPYPDADNYFASYAFTGGDTLAIRIPTAIVTAEDDPVIPVDEFHELAANPQIRLIIHPYGGHNGFIRDIPGHTWYETYMQRFFPASHSTEGA